MSIFTKVEKMNVGDDDIIFDENEDRAALALPEALETSSFVDKPSKNKLQRNVSNKAWLNLVEYKSFLKEYKPDGTTRPTMYVSSVDYSST
ncbi:unnamed protein product [Rotaria sp. Silwood2]|nr:unnamed protein product [Rotaria sp. Silwood2]CAF2781844.1 unnamed protein product [Rotaria sp. Silwood2]CAF3152828.1 unnamed protein product [Rotaria sp. Silwood2]CAF3987678.1 unnamed protein product [Rotaria sp. Silwood2]CAF4421353.1 unnamed protein product [Rotaria sp. Silwood2]